MEENSFKKRVEDLVDKFYDLNPDVPIPEDIVRENNELLEIDRDNLDLLEMKALILMNTNPVNENEIVNVYERILSLVPPNSEKAKEARDMIDIYTSISNIEDEYNNYKSGDDNAFMNSVPLRLIVGIKAIVIFILLFFLFKIYSVSQNENKLVNNLNRIEISANEKVINSASDYEDIKINAPSNYSFKTKSEIYNIRKQYVSKSKFATRNYEPNEAVFGSIVDYKPWWGLISCDNPDYHGDYHERIEGPSKVSVQMNNPDALVQVSLPYLIWGTDYNREYCTSEYSKFIPYSLKFSKKYNAYVLKYELTRAFLNYRTNINNKTYRYPLQLSGLNARDFGYNYVYAYNTTNIKMFSYNDFDMTNSIVTFADYVHLGGSCKYKDGCNNISPMQDGLMFRVTELPATISLKLWKSYPSSKNQKADLYYQIVFDEK